MRRKWIIDHLEMAMLLTLLHPCSLYRIRSQTRIRELALIVEWSSCTSWPGCIFLHRGFLKSNLAGQMVKVILVVYFFWVYFFLNRAETSTMISEEWNTLENTVTKEWSGGVMRPGEKPGLYHYHPKADQQQVHYPSLISENQRIKV